MKRLAASALAIAIALPACAQRGGHASFAAHSAPAARSAPAYHGGYASGPAIHYASPYGASSYAHAPVAYPSSMRLLAPGVRYPVTAPIIRPTFYHPPHGVTITTTHNYIVGGYGYAAYPYGYYPSYVVGYVPPDMLDGSYDDSYNSEAQPQPEPQPDYNSAYPEPMPQPEYGYPQPVPAPEYAYPYPQPAPEYPAQPAYPAYPQGQPAPQAYAYPAVPPGYEAYVPQPVQPQMQYVPGSSSTVILIYKDGRPPEQIQNYLATRSTLTVLDGGRRREIPLSDLNIPATISANRQTGVDFQLPGMNP